MTPRTLGYRTRPCVKSKGCVKITDSNIPLVSEKGPVPDPEFFPYLCPRVGDFYMATLLGTNTSRTSRHFWVDDFHFQRGICWFPGGYTGLKRVNSFQFLTEMTVCKSPKKKPLHVGGSWGSCWYGDMLLVIDIDIETSHQSNFFTKMHQVLYVFVIWRAGGFKDVYFLTQAGGNVQFNYNTFRCLKTNKYI